MLLNGGATPDPQRHPLLDRDYGGRIEGPVAVPTRESAPATRFLPSFGHYSLIEALLLARPVEHVP